MKEFNQDEYDEAIKELKEVILGVASPLVNTLSNIINNITKVYLRLRGR